MRGEGGEEEDESLSLEEEGGSGQQNRLGEKRQGRGWGRGEGEVQRLSGLLTQVRGQRRKKED
jgi:hypothetical protein